MRLKGSQKPARGMRVSDCFAGVDAMTSRTRKRTDGPAEEVGVRLGEGDHLLLAVEGRARGRRHGRDERRGAAEREGGDDLLHRFRFCAGKGG